VASPLPRVSHSASASALPGLQHSSGVRPDHAVERLAEEGAGHLVELQHAQERASNSAMASGAVSIMRCSEACACAMLTSAWRRRSMSSSAKVSCREPGAAAGDDGVADDPELAPVARLQAAFEGLGLALGQALQVVDAAQRVVGLGRGDDADRLAHEVGQLAAEHAARRAVHPLDAVVGDGDDAHQHRIEQRARALGLAGQAFARAVAFVDVDVGADDAGVGVAHRPGAPPPAPTAGCRRGGAAGVRRGSGPAAQRLRQRGLEFDAFAGVGVQLGPVQRRQLGRA
jgi:hypothetical protein